MNSIQLEYQNTRWRALQIYTTFRIITAFSLLIFFLLQDQYIFFGKRNPSLFYWSVMSHCFLSFTFFITNHYIKKNLRLNIELQVLLDICFITIFIHASGSISTGLGMLMAVSVMTGCLLISNYRSMTFAAIATTAVLSEAFYFHLLDSQRINQITQAGFLGATFFSIALFALITAKRLKESQLQIESTSAILANMEKLNEHIIQFMKTGVIVVGYRSRIQFINTAAWTLLDMPENAVGQSLNHISPKLDDILKQWQQQDDVTSLSMRHSPTSPVIHVSVTIIDKEQHIYLIFLEDSTPMTKQALDLKLASLGRLTASIAHEIRNPLGALSHAAQLLDESKIITEKEKKLVSIIEKNANRVNIIIENVMQLSRKKPSQPSFIKLLPILENTIHEFKSDHDLKQDFNITLQIQPENQTVMFDTSQLHQVIYNLCENALKHAFATNQKKRLTLISDFNPKTKQFFLDIIDNGLGIEPQQAESIFEPFFTSSNSGTGLGLYVSRELCEINQAHLDYIPIPSGGSCFRISFSKSNTTLQETALPDKTSFSLP